MPKNRFTKRTEFGTYRNIAWHPKVREEISLFPEDVRKEIGYLLYLLQTGAKFGMPHSRPMSSVKVGVSELRVKGQDNIYRVFYFTKSSYGILVFHAFLKKTQVTPQNDILLGRKRLKELLENLDG